MNLGNKLIMLRKNKNMSQEEVAQELDVTRQTVSKWETGVSTPDFDKILPICRLYNISTDELLNNNEINSENELNNNNLNKSKPFDKLSAFIISLSIFLYFVAVVALILLVATFKVDGVIATSIFLLICGVSTCMLVFNGIRISHNNEDIDDNEKIYKTEDEKLVDLIVTIIYLIISFTTFAWHMTWIIFLFIPILNRMIKPIENKDVKKRTFKILYVTLALIFIAIFILLINSILSKTFFNNFNNKEISTTFFETNEFNNINIDTINSDVVIKESLNDKIKVVVNSNNDKNNFDIYVKDNNLMIIDKKENIGFCFMFSCTSNDIVIYIPKDVIKNLNFIGISADLETYILLDNLNFDTISGDITLNSVETVIGQSTSGDITIDMLTSKIDLNSISGDVDIKNMTLLSNSSINTVSGDVDIDKLTNINVEAYTTSGDIDVDSDKTSDIKLNIDSTSGDISTD